MLFLRLTALPALLGLLVLAISLPSAYAQDIFKASRSDVDTSMLTPKDDFLSVEKAFVLQARIDDQQLILLWKIAPGYYLYQERFKLRNDQQLTLIPEFSSGTTKYDDFFEKEMTVFHHDAELRLALPTEATAFNLEIESQGCADAGLCYPPYTEAIRVDPSTHSVSAIAPNSLTTSASIPASSEAEPMWLLHAILFAILGGVILNLMPCVFPVLSIKVMSLAQADRERLPLHGWIYSAGIVSCFVLLAVVLILARAGGEAIGWGFQLQSPLLITLLIYLFFIMGLSLSGMLNIGTRWMNAGQSLTQKSGLKGSFFTGVLAAIVASPCTAPFMGAALGFALTQPGFVGLSIFAALGFGMALPLLALCYLPSLAERLPRPGPWMETLKEILAFPLFATAIWLLWVLGRQAGVDTLIIVCVGAMLIAFGIWLLNHRSQGVWQALRIILMLTAWLGALILPWQALTKTTETSRWQPYSAERLSQLRDANQAVLVNLTADWCLTCLANERLTLSADDVQAALDEQHVVTLKGDWTNRDPNISQLLTDYGRSGVPLYLWFPPGHQGKGEILPQLLTRALIIEKITLKQNP